MRAEVENDDSEKASPGAADIWRYENATRAHVVVDCAPYYSMMQHAMLNARQQILLIGWDFDTRIEIGTGRKWWNPRRRHETPPSRLGAFVIWLANHRPDLQIRVLKWNFGALKMFLRGTMMFDLARWWRHPRIDFKLDSAHPLGCSHHQKIVVIDDQFAVCGGIDMSSARWDTREHRDTDPRRKLPNGKLYGPWHDCTMMVEGDVAAALGELGRQRWERAGGKPLAKPVPQAEKVWPEALKWEFENVPVGIARTVSKYQDGDEIREIEALFLANIARAKRFIYAESQYFASRKIAEAIALRMREADPPEIVLINPEQSDGWLEQTAMDGARQRLYRSIKEVDHKQRFRIFHPFTTTGKPIYVHAKLMIVDDEVVRVGSANMNNRSLGLDSECDLIIDCDRCPESGSDDAITRLRHSLLAEHCAMPRKDVAAALEKNPSMIALIESRPKGGKRLEPLVMRELSDVEKAMADNAALDPERPEEMLSLYRRGLFKSRILRRPM